jgi:pimeloyl-ACP methyl ester carboxylesterase
VVLILLSRIAALLSRVAPRAAARFAVRLTGLTRGPRGRGLGQVIGRHRLVQGEVVLRSVAAASAPGAPRVLLIHGWNAASDDWHALAQRLQISDVSVYAADMPGHGATRGRFSSLPRFVRALELVDRAHGPFDVWIGHSMGANAALAAVARGARAGRLVLIASLVRPAQALRGFAEGFGLTPAATRAYIKAVQRAEVMPLNEVDAERNARRVRLPTLVVHDVQDRVIPFAHAQALAAALTAARVLRTDGLGHRRLLASEPVVGAVADFATGAAPRIEVRPGARC